MEECVVSRSNPAPDTRHSCQKGSGGNYLPPMVTVLIDFWATWCEPCKKEMPGYQKLADAYGTRAFVLIGLKFDTMPDMQEPLQFAKGIGVHYPLAVATEDIRQKFGGIEGLPTTMLYDRQGILRTKVIGFEYTDKIEQALKPLL